jgi:hypothetical protein
MEDLHQKNTKLLQSEIARRPNEERSGQLTEWHDMAAAEPSLEAREQEVAAHRQHCQSLEEAYEKAELR